MKRKRTFREAEEKGSKQKKAEAVRKASNHGGIADRARNASNSRILQLPAELREYIYMLAFSDNINKNGADWVEITPKLKQPALVQTCSQIRGEALKMWYSTRSFYITIRKCDDSLFSAFVSNLGENAISGGMLYLEGSPNRANLMKWCHNIFRGKSLELAESDDGEEANAGTKIIEAAHKITLRHRDEGDSTWEACKEELKGLKKLV